MKFSVLLPTRNRLQLLKYAVESVLRQDFDDWEVVIADNQSDMDVGGYVASLKDGRIACHRTASLLPVTENWNFALEKSTGDYIVMLGDDDCLVQGYFTAMSELIRTMESPDFIYHKALVYSYPGVTPGFPDGFLRETACASFFENRESPFFLDPAEARALVRESMNFRFRFDYNMQYSLIRRSFIDSLGSRGSFFQSPYPDYYASNVMFLKGDRILVCPKPFTLIGVSPKSFGFYYENRRESQGVEFLHNDPDCSFDPVLSQVVLPGTAMNTSWLMAMEQLKRNYGRECEEYGLRVNYRRYRRLQIERIYYEYFLMGTRTKEEIASLENSMTFREKHPFGCLLALAYCMVRVSGNRIPYLQGFITKLMTPYPKVRFRYYEGAFANILEVFERVDPIGNSSSGGSNRD